jgi:hypothetical protein
MNEMEQIVIHCMAGLQHLHSNPTK